MYTIVKQSSIHEYFEQARLFQSNRIMFTIVKHSSLLTVLNKLDCFRAKSYIFNGLLNTLGKLVCSEATYNVYSCETVSLTKSLANLLKKKF